MPYVDIFQINFLRCNLPLKFQTHTCNCLNSSPLECLIATSISTPPKLNFSFATMPWKCVPPVFSKWLLLFSSGSDSNLRSHPWFLPFDTHYMNSSANPIGSSFMVYMELATFHHLHNFYTNFVLSKVQFFLIDFSASAIFTLNRSYRLFS